MMRADLLIRVILTTMSISVLASSAIAQATNAEGRLLAARKASPTVSIKVWNPNGTTRFIAWDKDSVVVRGKLSGRASFFIGGTDAGLKLGAEETGAAATEGRSDLVAYVPRRATLAVKTVSADITGEGTSGWFYSVSGNIRLSGNAKSIEAETMNGSLDLNVTTPWLKARAGDGNILLRGAPEDVDASTIGGTISIATSSVLRGQFSSVAGDIHFAAAPSPHGIFEFSNHSGNVELAMPSNVSATLALSTVSGAIENGFPRVRPTTNGRQAVRLSFGGGDAQITVRTFKGAIRLRAQ